MTVDKTTVEQLDALAAAALTPAPRPSKAMNPTTGELLELASTPTDVLAEQYREVSNFVQNGARAFQRAVADELLARMDHEREYTVHVGHWTVEGDSANRTEIDDAQGLYEELTALAASGVVSQEAVEKGFKTERKAVRSGLNALKRVPGPVRDAIEAREVQSQRPRQVRVKPKARS